MFDIWSRAVAQQQQQILVPRELLTADIWIFSLQSPSLYHLGVCSTFSFLHLLRRERCARAGPSNGDQLATLDPSASAALIELGPFRQHTAQLLLSLLHFFSLLVSLFYGLSGGVVHKRLWRSASVCPALLRRWSITISRRLMRSRWKGSPHCEQTGRSGREAGGSNKSRVGPSRIADRSDPTSPNEREMETRGIGGKILLLGTLSLSSFCSITTSESATTTTCPAVHTMASRIKSVSQQSPAALMGEGGREVKGSPRPRLFLFLIRNRFSCLVLVGFPLSTFVCVCPVVVTSSSAFEERGDVQTTKEKGLSLFPGVDWKDARRSVRPDQVLITRWKLMGGGSPPPASIIDMMGLLQRHRMAGNSRL